MLSIALYLRVVRNDLPSLIILFVLTIIFVLWLVKRRPVFVVEEDGIFVHGVMNRKIYYHEICEIRRVTTGELGIGVKLGIQFPNTCFGLFHYNILGEVYMNSGNNNKMVLIKTESLQFVISPDEPDEFITLINSRRYH